VHVWTPAHRFPVPSLRDVEVHLLPQRFGFRWLIALHRGICRYRQPSTILVQYVPHMYGWKAMNIAFCCWLAFLRNSNVSVMFHEVAFPFRPGQPWKHDLLALVHRAMAWGLLRSAKHSFTSIEHYRELLGRLGSPKSSINLLRIFSNVPSSAPADNRDIAQCEVSATHQHVLGVFSSFGNEICPLLEAVFPRLLENPKLGVLLVGPASSFVEDICQRFPSFKGRIITTGRLNALEAGSYLQRCDVLLQLYPGGACAARGTLLAALASGVPVVTTLGPLTDPVLSESGALAFAENHLEAIRTVVESLLSDPAAAGKLGARGREIYEQHFGLPNTIRSLRNGNGAAMPAARRQ
jgi:glycosyltransferase involved in cell wall biosynthesis